MARFSLTKAIFHLSVQFKCGVVDSSLIVPDEFVLNMTGS